MKLISTFTQTTQVNISDFMDKLFCVKSQKNDEEIESLTASQSDSEVDDIVRSLFDFCG